MIYCICFTINYIVKHQLIFIECSTKANLVMVFGEITTKAKLDFVKIVRDTLQYIGYDDEEHGMATVNLIICLHCPLILSY